VKLQPSIKREPMPQEDQNFQVLPHVTYQTWQADVMDTKKDVLLLLISPVWRSTVFFFTLPIFCQIFAQILFYVSVDAS
jgi:hypothetical protein